MKLINLLIETIEDSYPFCEIAIEITKRNSWEARDLREKTPYKNLGVATFISDVFLWRVIDQNEFDIIFKGKNDGINITGGDFSIKVERQFGPSFTGSRKNAIEFGIGWKKSGRLKGNLYLLGINGYGKEFLNVNMLERLKEQGLNYGLGAFEINSCLGDTTLGYSVSDVKRKDLKFVYKINEEDGNIRLEDITYDML